MYFVSTFCVLLKLFINHVFSYSAITRRNDNFKPFSVTFCKLAQLLYDLIDYSLGCFTHSSTVIGFLKRKRKKIKMTWLLVLGCGVWLEPRFAPKWLKGFRYIPLLQQSQLMNTHMLTTILGRVSNFQHV